MSNCFICEVKQAETTFTVGLQKVTQSGATRLTQFRNVEVPICYACKRVELAAISGNARIGVGALVVLVVLGAIVGGWGGAGLGFGLGFFVLLIVNAMKKTSKLASHPECKALEPEGFRVTYP